MRSMCESKSGLQHIFLGFTAITLLASACLPPKEPKGASASFHALAYRSWYESTPADDPFYRWFVTSKSLIGNPNPRHFSGEWESLGPSQIAGRSLCLTIHPSDTGTIWMGSAGSGLWRSRHGGLGPDAWENIPTGYPVMAIASLAIDPENPQIIYAGTGENYTFEQEGSPILTRTLRGSRGMGLLKSADAGKNWTLLLDWSHRPNSCIWKIVIDPHDTRRIYLATNSGLLRSENGGLSWQNLLAPAVVADLAQDPHNPSILYAGLGGIASPLYGLYKTGDRGQHWERIPCSAPNDAQGRIMVHISKGKPGRVVAAFSDAFRSIGILRTDDHFETTSYYTNTKDVCSYQGWYAKSLHLKDDDPKKMLIGGVDLYYDSSGTGNKLINLVHQKIRIHADFHDLISNPLDPDKVYFATDGGVYRTDDFCRTVFPANDGYLSAQFYTGSISHASFTMIGGLQDNKSAYFEQGEWRSIHWGDGTFNAFVPNDDRIIFVASQFQNLYRSADKGNTWQELIPTNDLAAFIAPFALGDSKGQLLYSGGNTLSRSFDGGKNWLSTSLESPDEKITAIAVNATTPSDIMVASFNPVQGIGKLYLSSDYGQTLRLALLPDEYLFIRDIAFSPWSDGRCYLATNRAVFASMDSGASWYPLNSNTLPDITCHCILADPEKPEVLYVGTDLGLFVSFDAGRNWEESNSHPYDVVSVYDIHVDPHTGRLILFTHGHGAFSCNRPEPRIASTDCIANAGNEQLYIYSEGKQIASLPAPPGITQLLFGDLMGRCQAYAIESNAIHLTNNAKGLHFLFHPQVRNWVKKIIVP